MPALMEETLTFGEWLVKERKARGWTQEQLAEKIGFTKSYVSNIERNAPHSVTGALPEPSPKFLKAVSDAFALRIQVVLKAAFPEDEAHAQPGVIVVREGGTPITADEEGNIIDLDDMEETAQRVLRDVARLKRLYRGKPVDPE